MEPIAGLNYFSSCPRHTFLSVDEYSGYLNRLNTLIIRNLADDRNFLMFCVAKMKKNVEFNSRLNDEFLNIPKVLINFLQIIFHCSF